VLTVGYIAFFLIHITQVIRAGWNNFRAMVIGVEVAGDGEPSSEYVAHEPLEAGLRRVSRRGFGVAGAAALAGLTTWRWLVTTSEEDGLPWPFRRVLQLNERLAQVAFRMARLAPEFPRSAAREPRVNGEIGIDQGLDLTAWKLRVIGSSGERGARLLDLAEIKAMPRVEMTTELKCIEGWSTVVHWTGARLADLANLTGLAARSGRRGDPEDLLRYAALETPDAAYYVALDIASALHPQTLLCYEMDGQPLTLDHGAPLRLVIPVKYGIKKLKQIGTIRFTDRRPADYWAERGYDWYAGH
jgi:DMSO/TMAO reductase YedYZ molybdopterin-dependent catalytic subunit